MRVPKLMATMLMVKMIRFLRRVYGVRVVAMTSLTFGRVRWGWHALTHKTCIDKEYLNANI